MQTQLTEVEYSRELECVTRRKGLVPSKLDGSYDLAFQLETKAGLIMRSAPRQKGETVRKFIIRRYDIDISRVFRRCGIKVYRAFSLLSLLTSISLLCFLATKIVLFVCNNVRRFSI